MCALVLIIKGSMLFWFPLPLSHFPLETRGEAACLSFISFLNLFNLVIFCTIFMCCVLIASLAVLKILMLYCFKNEFLFFTCICMNKLHDKEWMKNIRSFLFNKKRNYQQWVRLKIDIFEIWDQSLRNVVEGWWWVRISDKKRLNLRKGIVVPTAAMSGTRNKYRKSTGKSMFQIRRNYTVRS